ncbi:MAG: hypothetical protein H7Y18_12135 [Clostridiaceae bacterium]|nr:hypothetical protein [Clostridiaceae bacterium]
MKSSSVYKLVIFLILVAFLVIEYILLNTIFIKPKITTLYTQPTIIVESSNFNQIQLYEKHNTFYAVKHQGILKYYWSENNKPKETLLVLEDIKYHKLLEGNTYWFDIKLTTPGDVSNGIIKSFYAVDIMMQ